MARYIDAERLCRGLKDMASVQYPDKQKAILGVVSTIENIPTADVEKVVRCSECAYCAENICPITGHKMYFCAYHQNNYPVTLTHYCGHGKRKVE